MIRETLTNDVNAWERLRHPALLQRFVLARGEEFHHHIKTKRGERKLCFQNATKLVSRKPTLTYVEGYVMRAEFGFPILHAWAVDAEGRIHEPTLQEPKEYEYFGVRFPASVLYRELHKNGYYGLLTGDWINVELIEELAPEVVAEAERVMGKPLFKVRSHGV